MAYIKIDKKQIARMLKEAQLLQDDIVSSVDTDFMKTIAEAENRMIFDILKGLKDSITSDVVEVVRCEECKHYYTYYHTCQRTGFLMKMKCSDFCSYGCKKDGITEIKHNSLCETETFEGR